MTPRYVELFKQVVWHDSMNKVIYKKKLIVIVYS
jgi:hypothetical protein